MQRAIFSKKDLMNASDDLAKDYINCIDDLLSIQHVKDLSAYSQHLNTDRLQHSLNVSYYSYLIAKKLGLDERSIARAGILHDLYFYDWRTKDNRPIDGRHCAVHPQVALENARNVCDVNYIIEDAIVHHMWPMTIHMPKTKEGWILQAVDKYCALSEIALQGSRKLKYSRFGISLLAISSTFLTKL